MATFLQNYPDISNKKLRRSLMKEIYNQGNGCDGSSSKEEESVNNNREETLEESRKCLCDGEDGEDREDGEDGEDGEDEVQW
jgi:hypothetical protein